MEIASLTSPSRLRSMLSPACSPRAVSAIARAGQAAFNQYHAILGSPLAHTRHTKHTRHTTQSTEPATCARKLTWAAPLHQLQSRQCAKSELASAAGPTAAATTPEQKLACHLPAGIATAAPPAITRHGNFFGVCTCVIRTRHAIAEIIAHLKPAGNSKVAAWRSILALCLAAVLIGEAGVRAVQAGIHGVGWDVSGGVHRGGGGSAARSIGMKLDVHIDSGIPHTIVAVNLQDVQLQSETGVCLSVQSIPVHNEYLSQFTASEHTSVCASPVQVQRAQLPAVPPGPFSGMLSTGQLQQLTFVIEGLKPGAYKVSLVSMSPGWKRTTLSSTFHVPLRVLEHSAGRLVPALRASVLE